MSTSTARRVASCGNWTAWRLWSVSAGSHLDFLQSPGVVGGLVQRATLGDEDVISGLNYSGSSDDDEYYGGNGPSVGPGLLLVSNRCCRSLWKANTFTAATKRMK
ncbi:hypothetical protein PG991_010752 [Apiospora marii]|uniref:Uncharacterized protein n=1 Tax=Apiospora marii TaxID=335849 RepID=A0ABR1RC74_9PEZI